MTRRANRENEHRKSMFSTIPFNQIGISLRLYVRFAMHRTECSAEYALRDINSPFMLYVINKSEIYIDRPMELTTTIQIVCCVAVCGSHCTVDRLAKSKENRNLFDPLCADERHKRFV